MDFIDRADQQAHLIMLESFEKSYERVSPEYLQTFSIESILHLAGDTAHKIELHSTLDRVWENGPFTMAVKVGITYQELRYELKVLREAIEADAEKRLFLFVPTADAQRLQLLKDEWAPVWRAMPESHEDSFEATICFALDRHTACVFHRMRIAEYGLRYLAKRTATSKDLTHKKKHQPIELADWNAIITAINNKIEAWRSRARSSLKFQTRVELYSDANDHCTYMKDIWRNSTSHARRPYDKVEARRCLSRVENFMQFLAKEFGHEEKRRIQKV